MIPLVSTKKAQELMQLADSILNAPTGEQVGALKLIAISVPAEDYAFLLGYLFGRDKEATKDILAFAE